MLWASLIEVSEIHTSHPLAVGVFKQYMIGKPRRVKRFFNEIAIEDFIYLVLEGLVPLSVHHTPLLSNQFLI